MWQVVVVPKGLNPSHSGRNEGGMIIYISDGEKKHEVGRVAFDRNTPLDNARKKRKFDTALKEAISSAQIAVSEANQLLLEADQKVKELLKQDGIL